MAGAVVSLFHPAGHAVARFVETFAQAGGDAAASPDLIALPWSVPLWLAIASASG
jgi:hypothetical protein